MKILSEFIFCFTIFFNIPCHTTYAQPSEDSKAAAMRYGLPVLPGVSGFGQEAVGGKGGKVMVVNNLNRQGKGSLAEAIAAEGPRIIVFEVGGVIDLEMESLEIKNPFITIAGQTAPSPGITLIKGGLAILKHEVIVQHLKIRPGEAGQAKKSGWNVDGIATGQGASNVIIDHCSATWATDENLSASGPRFEGENPGEWRKNTSHKITISNCLIASGLSNSTHAKGEHSKGTLVHDNATEILIYGNLYANNADRHPLCKGGSQTAIVNNFIYNPGRAVVHYGLVPSQWKGHELITGKMSVEGNYIEYGPNTSDQISAGNFQGGPVEVFWKDNEIISKTPVRPFKGTPTFVVSPPVWPTGLEALPAATVKDRVLKNAGAFPWDRDAIDQQIIDSVKAGTGQIIDSESEVGGYPVIKPVYRKFKAAEWDLNTMTKKKGLGSNETNAQKHSSSSADFSQYEEKYPWVVSRELVKNKVPGAVEETNVDEALVPTYTLPDIFTLANGKKVKTKTVWEQQRRQELLALFRSEVFGVAPPKPDNLTFGLTAYDPVAVGGKATFKRVAISFQLQAETFKFHLALFVPNQRQGKVPVFLLLNHRDTAQADPARKTQTEFWPVEYVVGRGYAIAVINVSAEIEPDAPQATSGIRAFYQKYYDKPDELNWGTLSAWAWAGSRAVDYLETYPDINAEKIAIIGHSRGGKTTLWAGAQDTRIALVLPNNTGDGGPALVRRRLGNTIEVMTSRNPHWFVPKYATYAGKENTMPVDQHMLVALVAPRGYHAGDGSEDLWHDPRGAWLSLVEASKVWAMYGNAHAMKDKMPWVNDLLINGPIAYHIREGGHGLLLYDWKLYLDHADALFEKK